MVDEIWKDIKNYEGIYQISNYGRVKSLSREYLRNGKYPAILKEKILKPVKSGDGYLFVVLYKNRKSKNCYIHSLIADAFIGPRPKGYDVCHFDGNKLNNSIDNLRYDTRSNNQLDAVRHGTAPGFKNKGKNHGLIAENNGNAKLTNDLVLNDILPSLKKGETKTSIAKRLGVHRITINDIVSGRCWSSITGIKQQSKN